MHSRFFPCPPNLIDRIKIFAQSCLRRAALLLIPLTLLTPAAQAQSGAAELLQFGRSIDLPQGKVSGEREAQSPSIKSAPKSASPLYPTLQVYERPPGKSPTLQLSTQIETKVEHKSVSAGIGAGGAEPPPRPESAPAAERFSIPADFEDLIAQSLGKSLPLIGADWFNSATQFAVADPVNVPLDYAVGPGDEVAVKAWGQIDIDIVSAVDRNGTIYLPKIGAVPVAGVRFGDLAKHLRGAIGKFYTGFELSVAMGQLRSVQIYVTGHARRPGTHTVSSLATVINAIFVTGGPAARGTLRAVELRRQDKVVATIDLYAFLLKGDKSRDLSLKPGDVIHFPVVGPLAAIGGTIGKAAIYEIPPGAGSAAVVDTLISLAGGLGTAAAEAEVTIERIDERRQRTVKTFRLDEAARRTPLKDGDLVIVRPVSPRFANTVTLRGNVAQPVRAEWRAGMRVADLIPGTDALLRPTFWVERNSQVRVDLLADAQRQSTVAQTLPEINWDYAVIERIDPATLTPSLHPFHLGQAVLERREAANMLLEAGDVVTVFSRRDYRSPSAKRVKYVRVEGEVVGAGSYQVSPDDTLSEVVSRAGGLTREAWLFGTELTRESTRTQQALRMREAVDRLERDFQRYMASRARNSTGTDESQAMPHEAESLRNLVGRLREIKPTGRIVLGVTPSVSQLAALPRLTLEDGDVIHVPPKPSTVHVVGAVRLEGTFVHMPGSGIEHYLRMAGGATEEAHTGRVYIFRADGSVVPPGGWRPGNGFLFGFTGASEEIVPGDTIVVPEDVGRISWTRALKDWTQILYQFGLGAAGIKILKGF